MPTYCYKSKNGRTRELFRAMGKAPKRVFIEGEIAYRDFHAESAHPSRPGNYPRESDAAGVHPDQVNEAATHAVSVGVPTNFNRKTGNPIFTSRSHENRFLRKHGLYHRNAGYGDCAPENR